MADWFETILESLRHAKKVRIEQSVSFGRAHPILRYPMFVIIVVFIFMYNFFLHLLIQMHLHRTLSKALAYVLSAVLVVSSLSLPVLADGEENVPVKITSFSALAGEVAEQTIYVGDDESKISFPSSLTVTIEKTEVIITKKEIEKEEKENKNESEPVVEAVPAEVEPDAIAPETSITEEQAAEEEPSTSSSSEEGENEEGYNIAGPEPSEELNPDSENEPWVEPESEQEPESETEDSSEQQDSEDAQEPVENTSEGAEDVAGNETKEPADEARIILDALMPAITAYAAESDDITESNTVEDGEIEYEFIT